jgi:hypothetical protein
VTATEPQDRPERPREPGPDRSLWPAALLITGIVAVLVVVFVALYPDDGTGKDRTNPTGPTVPRIIERPEDGRAPEQPGDPGGWQQLALLGLVVVGLGTVTLLVWRSSRKARSRGS